MSSNKLPGPDFDKLFGRIGNFILKPFFFLDSWLYPNKRTQKKYHGNRSCYCGSGYRHHECCGPLNDEKGLTAYEITVTHQRTKKKTHHIKEVVTHTPFLLEFEKGDINPVNSKANYKNSDTGTTP